MLTTAAEIVTEPEIPDAQRWELLRALGAAVLTPPPGNAGPCEALGLPAQSGVEHTQVFVLTAPPPGGALAPPVPESAFAIEAPDSATTASPSASLPTICLGEVIETMPAGAPIDWNTPRRAMSRGSRPPIRD